MLQSKRSILRHRVSIARNLRGHARWHSQAHPRQWRARDRGWSRYKSATLFSQWDRQASVGAAALYQRVCQRDALFIAASCDRARNNSWRRPTLNRKTNQIMRRLTPGLLISLTLQDRDDLRLDWLPGDLDVFIRNVNVNFGSNAKLSFEINSRLD